MFPSFDCIGLCRDLLCRLPGYIITFHINVDGIDAIIIDNQVNIRKRLATMGNSTDSGVWKAPVTLRCSLAALIAVLASLVIMAMVLGCCLMCIIYRCRKSRKRRPRVLQEENGAVGMTQQEQSYASVEEVALYCTADMVEELPRTAAASEAVAEGIGEYAVADVNNVNMARIRREKELTKNRLESKPDLNSKGRNKGEPGLDDQAASNERSSCDEDGYNVFDVKINTNGNLYSKAEVFPEATKLDKNKSNHEINPEKVQILIEKPVPQKEESRNEIEPICFTNMAYNSDGSNSSSLSDVKDSEADSVDDSQEESTDDPDKDPSTRNSEHLYCDIDDNDLKKTPKAVLSKSGRCIDALPLASLNLLMPACRSSVSDSLAAMAGSADSIPSKQDELADCQAYQAVDRKQTQPDSTSTTNQATAHLVNQTVEKTLLHVEAEYCMAGSADISALVYQRAGRKEGDNCLSNQPDRPPQPAPSEIQPTPQRRPVHSSGTAKVQAIYCDIDLDKKINNHKR